MVEDRPFPCEEKPSPNFNERPEGLINLLVMHYTGMVSGAAALQRMCDPKAQVSAHYMVEENGEIFQLVADEKRAWHAGISCWRGRAALNDSSIGIEIVNPGHEFGYTEFPDKQMESVLELSQYLVEKYKIEPRNVVGHSDIAPLRKEDPGELFDWKGLAWEGVGLWPEVKKVKNPSEMLLCPGDEDVGVARMQKMLSEYGYHIRVDGYYGSKTEQIIKAFKRHFVPEYLNVVWDNIAEAKLKRLLQLTGY